MIKKNYFRGNKKPQGCLNKEIRKEVEYQGRHCFVVFGALQRVIGA